MPFYKKNIYNKRSIKGSKNTIEMLCSQEGPCRGSSSFLWLPEKRGYFNISQPTRREVVLDQGRW